MRYIYKIFHERNVEDFDRVYQERINYDSTVSLGLNIKPINQPYSYKLYYVPTNNMLKKITDIYLISNTFETIFERLPRVAQNQFINECLVEELYHTNELEGIKSTREEIAKSTKEIKLNKKSKKRFESMIKSYMRLLDNDIDFPKSAQDIRRIYDDITDGEIDPEELPDGEFYRKDITYILKKSGTGKVIHQGITPEKHIEDTMDKLFDFMNNNESIPTMIKVAIGHYYFGYIHPFYDGNGRTSRFISSMYLSDVLGNISTLSLSRGCNKFKTKYLEAFEVTNSIKSRGELNYFIETFLDIILETLIHMNAELKEKSHLLDIFVEKLKNEPKLEKKDENYSDILFVLAQNHFFDSTNGLTIKELAEIFQKSEATIRKIIKELLGMSLIHQIGEKPAYYNIIQEYFEV